MKHGGSAPAAARLLWPHSRAPARKHRLGLIQRWVGRSWHTSKGRECHGACCQLSFATTPSHLALGHRGGHQLLPALLPPRSKHLAAAHGGHACAEAAHTGPLPALTKQEGVGAVSGRRLWGQESRGSGGAAAHHSCRQRHRLPSPGGVLLLLLLLLQLAFACPALNRLLPYQCSLPLAACQSGAAIHGMAPGAVPAHGPALQLNMPCPCVTSHSAASNLLLPAAQTQLPCHAMPMHLRMHSSGMSKGESHAPAGAAERAAQALLVVALHQQAGAAARQLLRRTQHHLCDGGRATTA